MYEPVTVEIDRGYDDGTYLSPTITFTGRVVRTIEEEYTTMTLYEWGDRGSLVYLVHVEEDRPGWPPRRTLYPFVNTHLASPTPTKGYTAEEVSRAYPEFATGKSLGRPRRSPTR